MKLTSPRLITLAVIPILVTLVLVPLPSPSALAMKDTFGCTSVGLTEEIAFQGFWGDNPNNAIVFGSSNSLVSRMLTQHVIDRIKEHWQNNSLKKGETVRLFYPASTVSNPYSGRADTSDMACEVEFLGPVVGSLPPFQPLQTDTISPSPTPDSFSSTAPSVTPLTPSSSPILTSLPLPSDSYDATRSEPSKMADPDPLAVITTTPPVLGPTPTLPKPVENLIPQVRVSATLPMAPQATNEVTTPPTLPPLPSHAWWQNLLALIYFFLPW
jgi:hypothetical protein